MTKLKNGGGHADDEVYGPPQYPRRDIVAVVCGIMDEEGPRPMKNMRPSQKNRNAADQFDKEHQGVYEERSSTNRRELDDVATHNSGYPKMHDELDKRRSTAKVSAINSQRTATVQQAAYIKCNNRFKKRKVESRNRSTLPKSESKKNRKSRQCITKGKSTKKQTSRKIYRLTKLRIDRYCQCSAILNGNVKKGGTTDNSLLERKMATERSSPCLDLRDVNSDASLRSKNGSHITNPDSNPSVSSYNSFGSMEQEPMVSD